MPCRQESHGGSFHRSKLGMAHENMHRWGGPGCLFRLSHDKIFTLSIVIRSAVRHAASETPPPKKRNPFISPGLSFAQLMGNLSKRVNIHDDLVSSPVIKGLYTLYSSGVARILMGVCVARLRQHYCDPAARLYLKSGIRVLFCSLEKHLCPKRTAPEFAGSCETLLKKWPFSVHTQKCLNQL